MITRSGWLVVVGSAALAVGGRVLGLVELYVLAGAGLLAVATALVVVRASSPRVAVRRMVHPDRVPVGAAGRVEIDVRAVGRRRSPVLTLVDPLGDRRSARLRLAPLGPGETTTAGYRLPTRARGEIVVGPLRAELTDPLGLARTATDLAPMTRLLVLPRIDVIAPLPHGSGTDPVSPPVGRTRASRGAEEFHALRPYVVGDDLRRVHWPMSARHDELVVRVDDEVRQGRAAVLLDVAVGPTSTEFETMVSAAASLVVAHARRGDRIRLLTTDGGDSGWLDGAAGVDALLAGLALVGPVAREHTVDPWTRASDSRADAVIAVVGDRSELEVATGAVPLVVRVGALEATTPSPSGPRVIDVGPGASFAEAWALAGARPTAGAAR